MVCESSNPRKRAVQSRIPEVTLVATVICCLALVLASGLPCLGQSFDEVHIRPRTKPSAHTDLLIPSSPSVNIIKKYVDVVLIPVTIMDRMNRLVKGLSKENFQIFDSKQRQDIRYFSSQDAPVSVGIILDTSGSMRSKIDRAREAVMDFLNTSNPQDEFFMITFSDRPELVSDFTQNPANIQSRLVTVIPKGRTSLLDAIYVALDRMKSAKYQRKALLVISDGGDNHSRYTEHDVEDRVKEADVLLYGIGIYDRYFPTEEELLGPQLLDNLGSITGGRAYTVDNPNELPAVAKAIGTELRNQYVIGYLPTSVPRDGKWHKIKVKLNKPKKVKLPPLMVYARTGYYAPRE